MSASTLPSRHACRSKLAPMTPTALAHKVTAADQVHRWRLDELMRAGYQLPDALVLSRRFDIDLHVAVDLRERGCPPGTAIRILL
jgi:hypothetical protein